MGHKGPALNATIADKTIHRTLEAGRDDLKPLDRITVDLAAKKVLQPPSKHLEVFQRLL